MLKIWTTRFITFALWALAAGSAAFWILQGAGAATASNSFVNPVQNSAQNPTPSGVAGSAPPPSDSLTPKVAAALGAKTAVLPNAASQLAAAQARFQLLGVLTAGSKNDTAQNGAALISLDGKPAKPYRVGAPIEDGLEVTSLGARSASIGSNGATVFTLELPLQK